MKADPGSTHPRIRSYEIYCQNKNSSDQSLKYVLWKFENAFQLSIPILVFHRVTSLGGKGVFYKFRVRFRTRESLKERNESDLTPYQILSTDQAPYESHMPFTLGRKGVGIPPYHFLLISRRRTHQRVLPRTLPSSDYHFSCWKPIVIMFMNDHATLDVWLSWQDLGRHIAR